MSLTLNAFSVPNMNGFPGTTVELRLWYTGASPNFITNDTPPVIVECGSGGEDNTPYQSIICTYIGTTIFVPQSSLYTTDDSRVPSVVAQARFVDENGELRNFLFNDWVIGASLGPSTTFDRLWEFNNDVNIPNPPNNFYTAAQINFILAHLVFTGSLFQLTPVLFSSLGALSNGAIQYCSDVVESSYPAIGGGTGSFVFRINGVWRAL